MEFKLKKDKWTIKDISSFENYLLSLSGSKEKREWEQKIVNTKLPCLAIPSQIIKEIIKEISEGNYLSFLDLFIWNNHCETVINGKLISKIKDFELYAFYLNKYGEKCDNWASVDCLKFPTKKYPIECFELAKEYLKRPLPFQRRIGVRILFDYINDTYIDLVFSLVESLINEEDYYVNMAISWLLCDCFIKMHDKTILFFKKKKISEFVLRKSISKCIDSFRISDENKIILIQLRN